MKRKDSSVAATTGPSKFKYLKLLESRNCAQNVFKSDFKDLSEDLVLRLLKFVGLKALLLNTRLSAILRKQREVIIFKPVSTHENLHLSTVLMAIQNHRCLKVLDLSGCSRILTAEWFSNFSRARSHQLPLQLEVLSLQGCIKLTDKHLNAFIYRFKKLRALDLRDCSSLTSNAFQRVQNVKNLEHLALGKVSGKKLCPMGNEVLQFIARIPPLETVTSITNQNRFSTSFEMGPHVVFDRVVVDKAKALASTPVLHLKSLLLLDAYLITDLWHIDKFHKTLVNLDLHGSSINDECGIAIASLTQLKVLCLAATSISSMTIEKIANHCKVLQKLSLSATCVLPRVVSYLVHNLTELTDLVLAACNSLDNDCIVEVLANLPKLKALDISNCWGITHSLAVQPFVILSMRVEYGQILRRTHNTSFYVPEFISEHKFCCFTVTGCSVNPQELQMAVYKAEAFNARVYVNEFSGVLHKLGCVCPVRLY